MSDLAAVKVPYMVLDPVTPSAVPNGSIFLDSTNGNALSQKNAAGTVGVLASSASTTNPFIKQMVAGEAFAANKPLAKRADGKVVLADSQDSGRTVLIGYSMGAALALNSVVNVLCVGSNIAGIISGMGFTPGQIIYVGETPGGFTNNVASFTGNNDVYMKVGIADSPAGVAQSAATDLIALTEFVSSSN